MGTDGKIYKTHLSNKENVTQAILSYAKLSSEAATKKNVAPVM